MGSDVVKDEAVTGGAKLVLLTNGLAQRTQRQARLACEKRSVPVADLPYTMEELALVTGKPYGVLAVCDRGFADMIGKLLPDKTT